MVFYSNDHSFGWGGMIFWMVVNALFWGAIIWAIIRMVAGSGPERSTSPDHDADALAVLKRRYAAGEIEDEEFQRRRQTLLQSH